MVAADAAEPNDGWQVVRSKRATNLLRKAAKKAEEKVHMARAKEVAAAGKAEQLQSDDQPD